MDPAELHRVVIERSVTDPDFRARLLAEPRAALSEYVPEGLPEAIGFRVVEEQPTEVVLVLPPAAGSGVGDRELAGASGGWIGSSGCTSNCTVSPCQLNA